MSVGEKLHHLGFSIESHRIGANGEFRVGNQHIAFKKHLLFRRIVVAVGAGELAFSVAQGAALVVGGYFGVQVVVQAGGE